MNDFDYWWEQRYPPHAQRGGANFTADQYETLLAQGKLARCNSTGRLFDWWNVEVIDQYADCTGFRCPCCKQRHDDRMGWGSDPDARMGYRVIPRPRPPERGKRWVSL